MLAESALTGPKQHRIHAWQHQECLLETHIMGAELTIALPKHAHDEYQISYSVTDPFNYTYRRNQYHIPSGNIGVLHPGEVHSSPDLPIRSTTSVFCILYVPSAHMARVAAQVARRRSSLPYLPDPVIGDSALAATFLHLHTTLHTSASRLEQDSRLLSALSVLVTHWAETPSVPHLPAPSVRGINHAREYLDSHCEDNVSLATLAEIAGLTEYHFCRAFGTAIGLSPHRYQMQARIHRAKHLIAAGVPLAQVASSIGFAQQSHFGLHFKRLVGVTPGQYARNVGLFETAIS